MHVDCCIASFYYSKRDLLFLLDVFVTTMCVTIMQCGPFAYHTLRGTSIWDDHSLRLVSEFCCLPQHKAYLKKSEQVALALTVAFMSRLFRTVRGQTAVSGVGQLCVHTTECCDVRLTWLAVSLFPSSGN